MPNVAGYIMTLRQAKGLSRKRLADLVDSTEMSILRIEKQGQEPSGALLVRIIDALGGSWEVVTKLLKSEREDALEEVLGEVRDLPPEQRVVPSADFSQFLDLVAEGMSPQEAAQIVRRQP